MDEKLKAKVAERKEFNIQKRKRGRPKQSEVKAKKVGNRNAIGRPKGDAAIINDYKSRMLASPSPSLFYRVSLMLRSMMSINIKPLPGRC